MQIRKNDIFKPDITTDHKNVVYPFVQYDNTGEKLCMSYTVDRKHIRISSFSLEKYII